jgi:hypothetical protein
MENPTQYKVSLNGNQFEALVRGEVITVRRHNAEIKILLQDVGFTRMLTAIQQAMDNPNRNT